MANKNMNATVSMMAGALFIMGGLIEAVSAFTGKHRGSWSMAGFGAAMGLFWIMLGLHLKKKQQGSEVDGQQNGSN